MCIYIYIYIIIIIIIIIIIYIYIYIYYGYIYIYIYILFIKSSIYRDLFQNARKRLNIYKGVLQYTRES